MQSDLNNFMTFTKPSHRLHFLQVTIVIGTALGAVLIILIGIGVISAQTENAWPTPPPAPAPQVPRTTASSDINLVNPPSGMGATAWVIDPIAALLPRLLPEITTELQTTDGLRVIAGAGSANRTVQMVYTPIPVGEAPQPYPGQDLRRVFDLQTYDHRGAKTTLALQRAWKLEVPILGLSENTENPSSLIISRSAAAR